MSNEDAVGCCLSGIAVLVFSYQIGSFFQNISIAADCRDFGKVKIQSVWYECTRQQS